MAVTLVCVYKQTFSCLFVGCMDMSREIRRNSIEVLIVVLFRPWFSYMSPDLATSSDALLFKCACCK